MQQLGKADSLIFLIITPSPLDAIACTFFQMFLQVLCAGTDLIDMTVFARNPRVKKVLCLYTPWNTNLLIRDKGKTSS
jgi:hypothetical protein